MQNRENPSDVDPPVRPSQFDDVLGRCGELELMLGRLRREHLVPDDEFAKCQRAVGRVREQLTNRQMYWEPRSTATQCPHCHTSGLVDYVNGLESRDHHLKCLGCGRVLLRDTHGKYADEECTEEWAHERVRQQTSSSDRI